jgi:membrane protease YdiL (CAAX protease family)
MVVDAKTGQTVFVSAPLPSPDPSVGWALNAHDDRGSRPDGASAVPSLTGRRLLATLGVWVASSVALGGATVFVAKASRGVPPDVTPIIVAEVYALFVVGAALVMRREFWGGVALKPTSHGAIVLVFPAWLLAYVTTALVQSLVGSWSSAVSILRAMGSDDGRLAHAGPVLATVILARACLLAPVGEELLFRGALFTWLRQRLSAPWTIAITSALFALIHGFPQILPLAFALGVAAGWVRERSGSTIPTIVAHVVNNVLMVGFSYWSTGWSARLPSWQ